MSTFPPENLRKFQKPKSCLKKNSEILRLISEFFWKKKNFNRFLNSQINLKKQINIWNFLEKTWKIQSEKLLEKAQTFSRNKKH